MAGKNQKPNRRKQLRAAVRSATSQDMPELRAARDLWNRQRFEAALQKFDQAVRKSPSNAIALADAARAFGARYEFERAEKLLNRLVDISGNRAQWLQMAGQSYRMLGRPRQAADCLERALSKDSDLFEARLELALLYERQHRLDQAMVHVEACRQRNPDSPETAFLFGRLLRRRGEADDARKLLREVASNASAHWLVRSQAWHELGQLLDEVGEYAAAFSAVQQGKEAIEPHASEVKTRSAKEAASVENLLAELKPEHFESWRSEASGPAVPLALLTGPPRSGTTLLEKAIDGHPDVVSADEQDAFPKYILPSLFLGKPADELLGANDLAKVSRSELQQQRTRYLQYLADAVGESLTGRVLVDKNPSIVMLIPGMLRLFPECKIIAALRDPRDVIVSCFMRFLPLNTVSVQFLTVEGAARRLVRDMEAWLRLREMVGSPWIEVRYEDTVADLTAQSRRVLQFLDVPWNDAVLSYRDRLTDRPVNSPTYEDVAKPIYKSAVSRWRHYEKQLAGALDIVEHLLPRLGY